MNIETMTITRRPTRVVVKNDEGLNIRLKSELVDKIAEKSYEDEDLIAGLLAIIDSSRLETVTKEYKPRRIPQRCLIDSIPILLERCSIEYLCDAFDQLKYHEIQDIIESNDPIDAFNRYF